MKFEVSVKQRAVIGHGSPKCPVEMKSTEIGKRCKYCDAPIEKVNTLPDYREINGPPPRRSRK